MHGSDSKASDGFICRWFCLMLVIFDSIYFDWVYSPWCDYTYNICIGWKDIINASAFKSCCPCIMQNPCCISQPYKFMGFNQSEPHLMQSLRNNTGGLTFLASENLMQTDCHQAWTRQPCSTVCSEILGGILLCWTPKTGKTVLAAMNSLQISICAVKTFDPCEDFASLGTALCKVLLAFLTMLTASKQNKQKKPNTTTTTTTTKQEKPCLFERELSPNLVSFYQSPADFHSSAVDFQWMWPCVTEVHADLWRQWQLFSALSSLLWPISLRTRFGYKSLSCGIVLQDVYCYLITLKELY